MAATIHDLPGVASAALQPSHRITSIDALRGLVMFSMIYVNDVAGAGKVVPDWMVHFSDRHKHGGSGMTFVDVVFPAFLFIVGMSIPFALRGRIARGQPWWRIGLHVLVRTASLLAIGILMVNGESGPDRTQTGFSRNTWSALLFAGAILAFCDIAPPSVPDERRRRAWRWISVALRVVGVATLAFLAFAYRDKHGGRIITLSPFSIRTEWYGILGLIGWAYLVASIVYLTFREDRTALLGCIVLLTCFYAADRSGFFDRFFLSRYVSIGETLGSQAAITVAGVMLATILLTPETSAVFARLRFTLLMVVGFAAAAALLNGLYGISKNDSTPSWCLWSVAITSGVWLILYVAGDVGRATLITRPLAVAGQNVLLAYLLSEGLGSWLNVVHIGRWYDHFARAGLGHAVTRGVVCATVILMMTALLNRVGFRVKV
jgi:predicted acyltransferase